MVNETRFPILADILAPCAAQVERDLGEWLIEPGTPAELAQAMRYCLAGGKRLRPALVFLAAQATGGRLQEEPVRRAAVAVELAHVYSLVHDDLPAMDDDALRRGRPTAHVQFGEAMAILIGDALLTRAFGVLAEAGCPCAGRLVGELARGAGSAGMVGGQVADMALCRLPDGPEGLQYIHHRKTASLLRAAGRMGAIAAGADSQSLAAITEYAEHLGHAFQLFDDLLDATATAEELGKTPGKDAQVGKRTVLTELGPARAAALGRELTTNAVKALGPLGPQGATLNQLVRLLSQRTS